MSFKIIIFELLLCTKYIKNENIKWKQTKTINFFYVYWWNGTKLAGKWMRLLLLIIRKKWEEEEALDFFWRILNPYNLTFFQNFEIFLFRSIDKHSFLQLISKSNMKWTFLQPMSNKSIIKTDKIFRTFAVIIMQFHFVILC